MLFKVFLVLIEKEKNKEVVFFFMTFKLQKRWKGYLNEFSFRGEGRELCQRTNFTRLDVMKITTAASMISTVCTTNVFISILDEVRCDFGSSIHWSFSWIELLSQVGGENQKCSPNKLVPMLTLSTDCFSAYLLCLAVIKTTALFCLCPKWKKLLSGWRSRAWKCIQVKIILSSEEDRSIPE